MTLFNAKASMAKFSASPVIIDNSIDSTIPLFSIAQNEDISFFIFRDRIIAFLPRRSSLDRATDFGFEWSTVFTLPSEGADKIIDDLEAGSSDKIDDSSWKDSEGIKTGGQRLPIDDPGYGYEILDEVAFEHYLERLRRWSKDKTRQTSDSSATLWTRPGGEGFEEYEHKK
jgi:hypothetical protein